MNEERVQFGARLKQQREARALSVPDVVKMTKIPERSLLFLEGGAFDELPAEVFVRGFLKSYCRAVGLDADELIGVYEGLTAKERKRPLPSLARVGVPARAEEHRAPEREPAPKPDDDHAILSALSGAGKGTGRMGLTLAVIILVIVATLTLSLLLRRPSRVGDGVSAVETAVAKVG
jgi:hypothetical protein